MRLNQIKEDKEKTCTGLIRAKLSKIKSRESYSAIRMKRVENVRSLSLLLVATLCFSGQLNGSQGITRVEATSQPIQSVLLDTTEQSALGWTKYPDGGPQTRTPGWVEESFTNFERGINWRSFVVCDVAFNSVNNWLWTPFIERLEANRLYIEIKFTMRDCNLFPQMVLSCKETFALLYKEMDAPIQPIQPLQLSSGSSSSAANASFAQSDSYTLVDAIAADEGRFTSNTDVVINTEIRSIPVSKRGVYFAFRDQGACLSLISIKVYHLHCPPLATNFALFNATPTGRDPTSLVAVEGVCVGNAVQIEQPKMFCGADGNWNSMSSGQCKCLAGFEPANNNTKCQACPPGKFKPALGSDSQCQFCPEHSSASQAGQSECKCHDGYFRAPKDPRSAACSQPPGPVTNLSATYVDSTSVVLQWQPPKASSINRDDLTYKLICNQCDQTSLVSSPQFYSNFSETKCVLSGLNPATSYRFLIYSFNGVSQVAQSQAQFSEITVQTTKQTAQTNQNTLSAQGGFQLTPIYNLRALPGARGTDMLLAWDAQPLTADTPSSPALELESQLPALYEIRFQPRHLIDALARRSPYPNALIGSQLADSVAAQQQSVTTSNRAIAISSLSPRTEYAFQIRAKWAHSSQWSEFSEPIYMATGNQAPVYQQPDYPFEPLQTDASSNRQLLLGPFVDKQQPIATSSSSWLNSLALALLCLLATLAFISITFVRYRKSLAGMQTPFGTLSGASYAGVYGSGALGPLAGFGSPLSPSGLHAHHHHQLSASSAGGLITGSNTTSRASSGGGTGNVVQNFIAATLNQLTSGNQPKAHLNASPAAHLNHTLARDSKLFGTSGSPNQQQRNHYHQTLSQSMLLGANQVPINQQQQQQTLVHLSNGACNRVNGDQFKYRTFNQQGAQFNHQDPQLHIYDDLDNTCSSMQRQNSVEIEPQRVSIESVIGRGEFGDVCLAMLRSPLTGTESRVAVKTLKVQANEKAKLDFLIEAKIMSQFEHPNIIHLEGIVTKSEPPMIVTEYMENGSLDSYLRDNKNRFTCLQLISMLRGIASGMQYLAKLNYVHKDLAARNILVNGQNVCKIADFGLSGHQSICSEAISPAGDYTNGDSTSTNSSNTLSSQTTGSTPTTASSTIAGANNLNQLQTVADQLAQQRFALQQQQQQLPMQSQLQQQPIHAIQNAKIPVRWTALEAIAFRRFTSASDVWSYGIVCWEVMSQGERPYWSWSNQDVIKAVEQGYRLPQPDNCPEQLYKLMLDCWLKDRAARPTFSQILKSLDSLLSPYDDPFCQLPQMNCQQAQQPQLVPMQTRISNQEPAYYDTYNPISQLINKSSSQKLELQTVDDWLSSIKMSRYQENFQRHQINSLQYVARLSQADLNLIGIQNGQHVKKILNAIMSLRSTTSIGPSGEGYLV